MWEELNIVGIKGINFSRLKFILLLDQLSFVLWGIQLNRNIKPYYWYKCMWVFFLKSVFPVLMSYV